MSSGSTKTVSEQLHAIQFTNEDFDQLRKALEGQQKKVEYSNRIFPGMLIGPSAWGEDFNPDYLKTLAEKNYEQSITLQHKLILLKRLINEPIATPVEAEESKECNCLICQIERMAKKNGGVGLEVLVSKARKNGWEDVPMNRADPKGSRTES